MSFAFYKILHFIGIITLFLGFGLMLSSQLSEKVAGAVKNSKPMMVHGIGLVLILLGGFGMAAKAKFLGDAGIGEEGSVVAQSGFPNWFWAKFGIWVALGGAAAVIKRVPEKRNLWLLLVIILGTCAVYLGVAQPF
ncbi:MAG: hypothetical protein WCI18_09430 [Pseudomonadota bacterium]